MAARQRYDRIMTQPINLNRFRKQKARDEARRQGDENAATHGRSKAQRRAEAEAAARAARHLDAHRREDGGDD